MNFKGKNRSIINKVKTFELVVSFIVRQRSYSLGGPGVTTFEDSTRVTYGGHHSIRSRLTSCESGGSLFGLTMSPILIDLCYYSGYHKLG